MKVLNLFSKRSHGGIAPKGIGAQQHFKNDCDLNAIIKKYPDGVLPPPKSQPVYGDFTALGKGLQDSMNALQFVSDWFAGLPAEIRAKFDNDPLAAQRFVISNPDGAVDLGILSKNPPKAGAEGTQAPKKEGAEAEPPKSATTTTSEGGATK